MLATCSCEMIRLNLGLPMPLFIQWCLCPEHISDIPRRPSPGAARKQMSPQAANSLRFRILASSATPCRIQGQIHNPQSTILAIHNPQSTILAKHTRPVQDIFFVSTMTTRPNSTTLAVRIECVAIRHGTAESNAKEMDLR